MKRIKNFLIAIIVSPELVVLLLVVTGYFRYPDMFDNLGRKLRSDVEIWTYLPGLTLGFSTAVFLLSSKLRAPSDKTSNRALYEWPMYQFVVDRVIIGIWIAVACGAASLTLWFVGDLFSTAMIAAIFLASTGVVATTAMIMFLSHQRLRELVDRYEV